MSSRIQSIGILVLVALLAVGGPLTLHFGQKSHNQLGFDVHAEFPPERAPNGAAFASTLAALIEQELDSRTGWRPNDFFPWGMYLWADNNANRQLGILQTVRETLRVMKDHLTKVSSDEFDPHLVEALLLPALYYGSPTEEDCDGQTFAVLFRSVFLEGLSRPEGGIRTLQRCKCWSSGGRNFVCSA